MIKSFFIRTSSWGGTGAGGGGVTVRQLEERLNKWLLEAREQEERFLKQAQHVNAWDRVLQQGHAQVHSLRNALDAVQVLMVHVAFAVMQCAASSCWNMFLVVLNSV
jgi:hypothetical protein